MSYFSHAEDQSLGSGLGCGKECNCGPCKSGMSGLDEWYEKEEADEPAPAAPRRAPSPSRPSGGTGPHAGSPKVWKRSGIGLGYYGLPATVAPGAGPAPSPHLEQNALHEAIRRGVRNPRQLSNIVFFARHPTRRGIPLQANEVGLMGEWRQIRDRIVLPALRQMVGPGNGAGGRPVVRPRRSRNY